jgi:hypothetical protein
MASGPEESFMIDAAILTQDNLSCIDYHLASREAFMLDDVILTEKNH